MAGRFKYDNKVFEVINAIVDLLVLGFFWIITSIPVFTMGASTTALYYTVNKSIRNKKGYAYREYWKAFKRNFKQATLCFMMWFVVAIFLVGDVIITKQVLRQDTQLGASYYFFLVLAGAALAWEFYLFSYIARFECTVMEAMKKSLFMMLANLGWSAALVAIFMACLFLCRDMMSLFILLPGGFCAIKNYILEKVFKKYRTPEDIARELEMNRTFSR